jgi:hypothetical protein
LIITTRPSMAKVVISTNQPKRAVFHAPTAKIVKTAQFE